MNFESVTAAGRVVVIATERISRRTREMCSRSKAGYEALRVWAKDRMSYKLPVT